MSNSSPPTGSLLALAARLDALACRPLQARRDLLRQLACRFREMAGAEAS